MSDYRPYIRLPIHMFTGRPSILISEAHDDEQFAAHEVEFVRHLFGRCAYLREHSRTTPVSDAFLSVFVNLIDILEANAPSEARKCVTQLRQVIKVVFPDLPQEIELQFAHPSRSSVASSNDLTHHNGQTPESAETADK
jgi:hypothetical protein